MSGDSLDIFGGSNPVTIDSTWTAMLKKTGSDSYHLTATRLFDRVEDMNEAIKGRKGRTPRKGTALHWRTHGSGTRNGIIGTSSSHTTGNSWTAWGGLRPVTPDGMPYIGRCARVPNLVVATGHAMLGVSLATVTGKIVAEIIGGQPQSRDLKLVDPNRYDRN